MFVRRAVAGVAASALALVLVGCAEDEPEPKFTEPTSSAPSPTPTESETPGRESAEDFIRRVTDLANRAQVEGDTTEYRKLTPQCEACQSFAYRVDEIYADGGSIEFEGARIVSIEFIDGSLNGYQVQRDVPATTIRDAAGDVQDDFAGGREVINLYLKKTARGWLLGRMLRAEVEE